MRTTPLFNQAVLAREVDAHRRAGLRPPAGAIDVLRGWHDKLQKGVLGQYTETQIEQAFNNDIFVKILGYVPLGSDSIHHIVPKRTGPSGRDTPDFVLGTFEPTQRRERWRVVGEIKGPSINLDLPQVSRPSKETPVQQGFRYAISGRPGVEWVIVTNFREIRLYRNGYSSAYHQWSLGQLCDDESFFQFFVLLRREHICPDDGAPEALRILEVSLDAGVRLTEGFYELYDVVRRAVIERLLRTTPTLSDDPFRLYGKAHKVLNRILFIAYCEDHPAHLLPQGTLKHLRARAQALQEPGAYWKLFRSFCRDLDKGSPPGAPIAYNAFNGGLFAEDDVIDHVDLSDSLFTTEFASQTRGRSSRAIRGILGFDAYDFADDLDVDALGAVFEQSLKDLPFLAKPVRGKGTQEVTRRSSRGVFYTPQAITQHLVSRALDAYAEPLRQRLRSEMAQIDKERTVGRRRLTLTETRDYLFLNRWSDLLKTLRVYDPACGSGAFLVEALRQLHAEYTRTNEAIGLISGAQPLFGLDRLILRSNIFGSDILSESVEITKLSIWLRTAAKDEPLESLDKTLWCADSLERTEDGTFDIVVSNPPWGADLPGWDVATIKARFPDCGEEKDSYAIFTIRAWELLKPGGILAYILPNSWLTVDGYRRFRHWLLAHFDLIEVVNVWKIFPDVNHDAVMIVARKRESAASGEESRPVQVRGLQRGVSERKKWQALAEQRWALSFDDDSKRWMGDRTCRIETIYEPRLADELDRIRERCAPLGECAAVTVGIQVYHQRKVSAEIIKADAFRSDTKKGSDWYPYVSGNQVQRYFEVPHGRAFLRYSDQLCDKRELVHYSEPRVLVQQITWGRLAASYSEPAGTSLYLNSLFSVTRPRDGYTLPYILAILNSRFASGAYERWTNRLFGDKFPKVSKQDIATFPIPGAPAAMRDRLGQLAQELQEAWQRMKQTTLSFRFVAEAFDGSGRLGSETRFFWNLDEKAVVRVLGATASGLQPAQVDGFVSRWDQDTAEVNSLWSRIMGAEEEVDDLVRQAYGMDKALYEEIIARAPAVKLEDVLLPL